MNFKKIIATIMTTILVTTVAGCAGKEEKNPSQTLKVGTMASIEAIPLILAKENGYFEELGLDADIQAFKSASDMNAAIQAGELDGILNDQVAITIFQNSGIDMKITGITDAKFTLVAGKDSGITKLEDLKGKKIGISENTVIDFNLDLLLEKANLTSSDVERVVIPAMPSRLEMLNVGQIDAAIMPDPFANAAIAAGASNIYEITADKDIMAAITAFTQESIDAKATEIKAFYEAYNKAVDYINNTPVSEFEDLVISTVGYPESMKGKITVPTFRKNQLPKLEEIDFVINWSKERGLLTKDITAKDIVNDVGVK